MSSSAPSSERLPLPPPSPLLPRRPIKCVPPPLPPPIGVSGTPAKKSTLCENNIRSISFPENAFHDIVTAYTERSYGEHHEEVMQLIEAHLKRHSKRFVRHKPGHAEAQAKPSRGPFRRSS